MNSRMFDDRKFNPGFEREKNSGPHRAGPIPEKVHEEKTMVRVGTVVRTLILGGLALTTLAFAKTDKSKTIVTYPYGFAVSQPVSELPIEYSVFESHVTPEPRPVPLRKNAVAGPIGQEDPILQ